MVYMVPLKGVVHSGHLRIDVPVDLPDDTEVELDFVRVQDPSELGADEQTKLNAALDRASAQIEAGQGIPGKEFFEKLRAGR